MSIKLSPNQAVRSDYETLFIKAFRDDGMDITQDPNVTFQVSNLDGAIISNDPPTKGGFRSMRKTGVAVVTCEYRVDDQVQTARTLVAVLPEQPSFSSKRLTLVLGPDDRLYLFTYPHSAWPNDPFMTLEQAVEAFSTVHGAKAALEPMNGITGAVLSASFEFVSHGSSSGKSFSFFLLNLQSVLCMLAAGATGFRSLVLLSWSNGYNAYAINYDENAQKHHSHWPTTRLALSPGWADKETEQGVAIVGQFHDLIRCKITFPGGNIGKAYVLNLWILLKLISYGFTGEILVSLSHDNGGTSELETKIYTLEGNGLRQLSREELERRQDWKDLEALAQNRVCMSAQMGGQGYLFNINAYADAARSWVTNGNRNEFLIRVPGDEPGGKIYCLDAPMEEGTSRPFRVPGELELLTEGQIAPSITEALLDGVVTGNILNEHLVADEPPRAGLRAQADSNFISCYLLDLKSLSQQ